MDTLFTVMGASSYEPMEYTLDVRKSQKVKYAPLALLDLLGWNGEVEVVAFLTPTAQKTHAKPLAEEIKKRGHEFRPVCIPEGRSEREIWEIFEIISESLAGGERVVLDITHGFRSIPILMLGAVLFLKEARGVELGGVYYGAYEARDPSEGIEPVFNLTPLVEMVEWANAVRIFNKYGHADEMGKLLGRIQDQAFRKTGQSEKPRQLKNLGGCMEGLSLSLAEGLPLEAGKAAWELGMIDPEGMRKELSGFAIPGEKLAPRILDSFKDMAIAATKTKGEWKRCLKLDLEELLREARLVDWYLAQGQVGLALGVMREWMVNRVILAMGLEEHWLDYGKARKPAERRLNVLSEMHRDYRELLTANQAEIGRWWQAVADRRNAVHHCGFRDAVVDPGDLANVGNLWGRIKERMESEDFWDVRRPVSAGTVLLSPLGLSRGLLYSALKRVQPAKLVVITSRKAEGTVEEILEKAGAEGLDARVLVMKDPYCGFDEAGHLASEVLRGLLVAEKVVANQTGGTTVMQFVIQRICERAKDLDVPVEEVALVDRRSSKEQTENPYVTGELIALGEANQGPSPRLSQRL